MWSERSSHKTNLPDAPRRWGEAKHLTDVTAKPHSKCPWADGCSCPHRHKLSNRLLITVRRRHRPLVKLQTKLQLADVGLCRSRRMEAEEPRRCSKEKLKNNIGNARKSSHTQRSRGERGRERGETAVLVFTWSLWRKWVLGFGLWLLIGYMILPFPDKIQLTGSCVIDVQGKLSPKQTRVLSHVDNDLHAWGVLTSSLPTSEKIDQCL